MGEARSRVDQGLPPRQKKSIAKDKQDDSPRIISWLPITQNQRDQFYSTTIRGGWIGIGIVVLLWVVVRFVGPAAGWWTPADS